MGEKGQSALDLMWEQNQLLEAKVANLTREIWLLIQQRDALNVQLAAAEAECEAWRLWSSLDGRKDMDDVRAARAAHDAARGGICSKCGKDFCGGCNPEPKGGKS